MNKYLVEYLGVLIIITAKLLTEANPAIMGIIYFSVFTIAGNITSGYFTPLGPIAIYLLGRGTLEDVFYNLAAQFAAAVSAVLFLKPLKAYMD
jgi:glycerol uptake facilitator-like aquaporin